MIASLKIGNPQNITAIQIKSNLHRFAPIKLKITEIIEITINKISLFSPSWRKSLIFNLGLIKSIDVLSSLSEKIFFLVHFMTLQFHDT